LQGVHAKAPAETGADLKQLFRGGHLLASGKCTTCQRGEEILDDQPGCGKHGNEAVRMAVLQCGFTGWYEVGKGRSPLVFTFC
jgi:hypothetical protein